MSSIKHVYVSKSGIVSSLVCDSSSKIINLDKKIRVNAPWTEKGWYEREVSSGSGSEYSRSRGRGGRKGALKGLATAAGIGALYGVAYAGEKELNNQIGAHQHASPYAKLTKGVIRSAEQSVKEAEKTGLDMTEQKSEIRELKQARKKKIREMRREYLTAARKS